MGEPYFVPQMQLSSIYLHFSCHQFSQALLLPKLEGGLGRWIKLFETIEIKEVLFFFLIGRLAAEEQERRDYQLAVRLAQVSVAVSISTSTFMWYSIWNGLCTVFPRSDTVLE